MRGVRNNGGAQHETVIKRAACLGLSGTALVALNSNELFPPDVSADGTVGVTSWDCITNKIKRSSSATWCDNKSNTTAFCIQVPKAIFHQFPKGSEPRSSLPQVYIALYCPGHTAGLVLSSWHGNMETTPSKTILSIQLRSVIVNVSVEIDFWKPSFLSKLTT